MNCNGKRADIVVMRRLRDQRDSRRRRPLKQRQIYNGDKELKCDKGRKAEEEE